MLTIVDLLSTLLPLGAKYVDARLVGDVERAAAVDEEARAAAAAWLAARSSLDAWLAANNAKGKAQKQP